MILLISLPAIISSGTAVTRLIAGMTTIGFSIAFVLPLIGGWLADKTQIIEMTLIPSLIFIIAVIILVGRDKRYSKYK